MQKRGKDGGDMVAGEGAIDPIQIVIDALELAPRIGLDHDIPEGSRYIILSDTLALELVALLKPFIGKGDDD